MRGEYLNGDNSEPVWSPDSTRAIVVRNRTVYLYTKGDPATMVEVPMGPGLTASEAGWARDGGVFRLACWTDNSPINQIHDGMSGALLRSHATVACLSNETGDLYTTCDEPGHVVTVHETRTGAVIRTYAAGVDEVWSPNFRLMGYLEADGSHVAVVNPWTGDNVGRFKYLGKPELFRWRSLTIADNGSTVQVNHNSAISDLWVRTANGWVRTANGWARKDGGWDLVRPC